MGSFSGQVFTDVGWVHSKLVTVNTRIDTSHTNYDTASSAGYHTSSMAALHKTV